MANLEKFRSVHLKLDKANDYQFKTQFAKQGDYNGRNLIVQITDGGEVKEQSDLQLNLGWKHQTVKNQGLDAFEAIEPEKGIFKITYPAEMMNPGTVICAIQIIDKDKITLTRNFKLEVEKIPFDDDAVVSSNSFTTLQEALIRVEYVKASEQEREANEATRISNENARKTAESNREEAEDTRESQESSRVSAENSRSDAESTRQTNESNREDGENSRVSAENTRKTNETKRQSAEQTREANESTRQSNEQSRNSAFDNLKLSMEAVEQDYADRAEDLEVTYSPRLSEVERKTDDEVYTIDSYKNVDFKNEVTRNGNPWGIESGSNDNGRWVRFPDGTQICWLENFVVSGYVSVNILRSRWTFPIEFVTDTGQQNGRTAVFVTKDEYTGSSGLRGASEGSAAFDHGKSADIYLMTRDSDIQSGWIQGVRVLAIGRWK